MDNDKKTSDGAAAGQASGAAVAADGAGEKKELARRGWLSARDNPWYVCAQWTTAVVAAFCLIVGGVLAAELASGRLTDPVDSPKLTALKARLKENPDDQPLRAMIQDEDLLVRAEKLRLERLIRVGAWLLLAGAGTLLVCGGYVIICRRAMPAPQATAVDQVSAAERSAGLGRLAAGGVFGILILIAILAGQRYRPAAEDTGMAATQPTKGGATSEPTPSPSLVSATLPSEKEYAANWPRFRGPGGAGVSAHLNVPSVWDGPSNKGILWKTPIPLPGENSPVVWGKRVFLTGATPEKRSVYCLDADTGKILWERQIATKEGKTQPVPNVMNETGYAAPTMATDGLRVFAIFANGDLAALDFDGKVQWTKNFGPMQEGGSYGYASSLTTCNGTLIVMLDLRPSQNAIAALACATGKEVWRTPRRDGFTWMTPAIISAPSGDQIITAMDSHVVADSQPAAASQPAGDPWVVAYDPATGKELWWLADCAGGDMAPSPVYGGGLVFVANTGHKMAAIRPDGSGDVSKTHVAWTATEELPDIVSPLTDGKRIWTVTTGGNLVCRAIEPSTASQPSAASQPATDSQVVPTGKILYSQELGESVNASPTLVGDKVYLLDCTGTMIIFEAADQYKELGRCKLGELANATPAFMDGRIYIRCKKNIYCVGAAK
ncbi:MAG: PQQ-binding-like beta-propeller repeat protein [Planctomycetes bacterium]|nr:PQQ-binding-like beta-propeller repeat protein [Planctomycetota bacterium]